MEIRSVKDFLNFIDSMILRNIAKHDGVEILENVRFYMIWMYNDHYVEEKEDILSILSQINLIFEKIFLNKECSLNPLNHHLRKHILTWFEKSNTKSEVDNHQ